jgi:hypothetical protein
VFPVLDFADLPLLHAGSNGGRTVSRSFVILTLIIERRGGVVDVLLSGIRLRGSSYGNK